MKGCALFIETADVDVAATLCNVLSADGRITVPFKLQFWGDHYGNFTDKFGVQYGPCSAPKRVNFTRIRRIEMARRTSGAGSHTTVGREPAMRCWM